MKRIAHFGLVSYEQFQKGCKTAAALSEEQIQTYYQQLKKPKRATAGSAGYDFYLPYDITLKPGYTFNSDRHQSLYGKWLGVAAISAQLFRFSLPHAIK